MGLEGLGRLPSQKKLAVGSAPGPTSYTRGRGIQVRVPVGEIGNIHDIISVWLYPVPRYVPAISGYSGNVVTVLLGYAAPSSAAVALPGKFVEVSTGTDVSDVSAFVAAMGR